MYDKVIKNANIISMTPDSIRYNWVAIKDGLIAALGSDDFHGEATDIMDVQNATVLPGLTDCHVHVINAGIQLRSVDLAGATSIAEVLDTLDQHCKKEAKEEWVFGTGYIPQNIKEQRYPTKYELDEISHGHKLLIFAATLHACALNSDGETVANVPGDTPGVQLLNGRPTGVYDSDQAAFIANENVLGSFSDDELWNFIEDCAHHAVKKGVTAIHGLFGQFVAGDRDVDIVLNRRERLPIDLTVFYQTWDVAKAKERHLPRVGGCLTLDGAAFEYTMANYEPYVTAPALRGVLYHDDEKVYKFISEGHKNNMQCSLHAVGERAIDQLLNIYRRVILEQGRKDLRHRIEHFCLPTEEQIIMAKDLDIVLSMQPGFSYLWDQEDSQFETILGRNRANRIDPFKKLADKGITVIGGSDCPVTPLDPLTDIAACINGYNPVRNISTTDALNMYTVNPAYSTGEENVKGTIEIGKKADLVVIDKNPYECSDSKAIYEMEVLYTIKDGKITYQNYN